jgi:hypothetical protein
VPQPGDPRLRQQVPVEQWVEEDPYQGRSWLQPVIVGTVVVALIAALAVGLFLIYRATGDGNDQVGAPSVAPSSAAAPVPTQTPPKTSAAPSSAAPSATTGAPEPVIITMPPLRGATVPEATIKLAQLGLNVRTETQRDDSVQPGEVIDSRPGEGELVEPGTTITLYVAEAPSPEPSVSAS